MAEDQRKQLEDVTKELNNKMIQEIIASGKKYIDSSGNEVKLK